VFPPNENEVLGVVELEGSTKLPNLNGDEVVVVVESAEELTMFVIGVKLKGDWPKVKPDPTVPEDTWLSSTVFLSTSEDLRKLLVEAGTFLSSFIPNEKELLDVFSSGLIPKLKPVSFAAVG